MVKKFLLAAAVLLTIGVLGPATAVARAPVVLSGGGTGTFDGIHPGSQFGMGVVFRSGTVQGHFNCVMAGRSAVPGLRLMKVGGQVSAGSTNLAGGTATFSGTGSLHMNNKISQVAFTVSVTAGGPGVGRLQLTVNGPPVGSLALGVETVATGHITHNRAKRWGEVKRKTLAALAVVVISVGLLALTVLAGRATGGER